jgi:hypothetical protein
MDQNGSFIPGGKFKPWVTAPILPLAKRFHFAHSIIHRRSNQVFQHFLVFFQQAVVNFDTLDVMTTRHRDLDQTGTRLAMDFRIGQFFLRLGHLLLHLLLHTLGLLHQLLHVHA